MLLFGDRIPRLLDVVRPVWTDVHVRRRAGGLLAPDRPLLADPLLFHGRPPSVIRRPKCRTPASYRQPRTRAKTAGFGNIAAAVNASSPKPRPRPPTTRETLNPKVDAYTYAPNAASQDVPNTHNMPGPPPIPLQGWA